MGWRVMDNQEAIKILFCRKGRRLLMGKDLISRQAAIDEIRKCRFVVDAIEKIIDLPSAQPAPCEFCKHNNIADDKVCLMCSAERRTDEDD